MGQRILILGESGTGKSASLRNFADDEIFVINSAGKPLPFRNHFECVTPRYEHITSDVIAAMQKTKKKVIVIDDAQYLMSFQYMRRIKEKGWDKWDDIQGDFFNIVKFADELPSDTLVYFLSHVQRDEDGREKMKTMGKMLDEKITLEGLFTTVLSTFVQDNQYFFITQNNGRNTVKSPIGMFSSYAIDNDLKFIDTAIRSYYELGEHASADDVCRWEIDLKRDIPKDEPPQRKRKRRGEDTAQPVAQPAPVSPAQSTPVTPSPVSAPLVETPAQSTPVAEEAPAEEEILVKDETPAEPAKRIRRRKVRTEEPQTYPIDHSKDTDIPF